MLNSQPVVDRADYRAYADTQQRDANGLLEDRQRRGRASNKKERTHHRHKINRNESSGVFLASRALVEVSRVSRITPAFVRVSFSILPGKSREMRMKYPTESLIWLQTRPILSHLFAPAAVFTMR